MEGKTMKINRCKTNHLINPIGFDMDHVTLTWSVDESISKTQKDARIIIASDPGLKNILVDTGYSAGIDNRAFEVDIKLTPFTRYYWNVEVRGDLDRAVSATHYFETGRMSTPWTAGWITPPWEDRKISPYMRKGFTLSKPVAEARAYIIGLGLYEMEINGQRIGEERLTPYCNAYDAWLQYQTYDVTESLVKGENVAGVMLGNGWAKGKFGTFGDMNTPYIHDFALLCEIRVTYEDGTSELILTDESWKCHKTPVLEDSIYDGEVFDENAVIANWSEASCDESAWENAKPYITEGLGPVVDRMSPPVIIKEELKPAALITTPAGEQVLDMGQNMVGWIRLKVNEPKGTKITLTHGEVLQNDNFYRDNLRGAKAQYTYISDGTEKIVEPHFTFYGFRYAKLEGFTKDISIDDFTGCVVYSNLETIGNIETSDPLVNRLFQNALWSQKDNFLDVPTDCPQRDERMGWTGDAEVFCGTANFNMDTYAFYTKFMRDLYEEQKFSGGMVASTVPTFTQKKHTESNFIGGGACAWSDAATVIPWEVYLHTGDKAILKRQYQSMKDWVDWIITRDKASGGRDLWDTGFQFGDWLALDGPVEGGVKGGTDNGLLASAYYRLSTNILAKTAAVLGKADDEKFYSERSEAVKRAIQNEFFSKTGRSAIVTQTAHVVGLHFDLVEEDVKNRVLNDLKALLKKSDMHLRTGFIGTPYLCRSLSDHGASDEAYQIFFQEDYPSWLYEVIMGATTIWERWNSILPDGKISGTDMNSLNHYAYGSIMEWVYRNVCGIKPLEDAPGFKKFVIKPEFYGKLTYAGATLQSPMGQIASRWEISSGDMIQLEVEVPFNAEAEVILSHAELTSVSGADKALNSVQEGQAVKLTLNSGKYTFQWKSAKSYKLGYSLSTPLWELKNNEESRAVLEKYFPHFVNGKAVDIGFEFPYTIQEVLDSGNGFEIGMMLRGADIEAFAKELEAVQYKIRS
jgi:alpha-L-rhamnosidase